MHVGEDSLAAAPNPVAEAATALRRAGLVVLSGPPGCGRSTLLQQVSAAVPTTVYAGGGLAMLAGVAGLALSRAVRAKLPTHDVHLLTEAVRSRVNGALLVLDDVQYADAATLAALPLLAAHCRVLVALRTPNRLPSATLQALQSAASLWLPVEPLDQPSATELARRSAPHLDEATLATVVARAGGNPLVLTTLARHAAPGRGPASGDIDQVAYALATALADLPRAARTALAALGLLGRPTSAAMLGPGVDDLRAAGLITANSDGTVVPASTYLAEAAAGLLDQDGRVQLHLRLAQLTPPAESARHLAAAGDLPGAHRQALHAADQATGSNRAALLLFACELDVPVDPRVRIAAADAALAAGRADAAVRVLSTPVTPALGAQGVGAQGVGALGVEAEVLLGEALLQVGDLSRARAAVGRVPDSSSAPVRAARDRVLLLAELASDPGAALDLADKIAARYPNPPVGIASALAAVHARHRVAGWDTALAATAAALGDPVIARWSAWLLVEHLAADGRLSASAAAATQAARACADNFAYGWQTRFLAAAAWAGALSGATGSDMSADEVLRSSVNLLDRSVPVDAFGYATAAAALIEADTGLLAAARAHLDAGPHQPSTIWVERETAWLDGQPERAARTLEHSEQGGLLVGLHAITARWAAHDLGVTDTPKIPPGLPAAARRTLTAWATGTGFSAAAEGWQPVAVREQVRCLLAAGLTNPDPARAVEALLGAERLADAAGLTVLAGRARRGLRRHQVHRDVRGPRAGDQLTRRENDVLQLVAAGEPTRRIAGQLGISCETVDTHIRAGMRKLGARTRTEAAALVFARPAGDGSQRFDADKDGR